VCGLKPRALKICSLAEEHIIFGMLTDKGVCLYRENLKFRFQKKYIKNKKKRRQQDSNL